MSIVIGVKYLQHLYANPTNTNAFLKLRPPSTNDAPFQSSSKTLFLRHKSVEEIRKREPDCINSALSEAAKVN